MALRRPRRKASKRPQERGSEPDSEGREERRAQRAERSSEARAKGTREARDGAQQFGTALKAGGGEVLAIGREMIAIPAGFALALAERLGLIILAILRWLRPIALAALAYAKRAIDFLAREITPARAIAAVALAASILLAISQFVDYRDVQAGVPAYADVELVAPPPTVSGSQETAGSAHLYVLLLGAIAAAAIVVLSMLGRWRLARLLFPIGLVGLLIVVLVDAPSGLDEGIFATQFQGAEARLLGAFWVEVTACAVIALCGPLLALALRPQRTRPKATASPRRRRRLSLGRGRVQGAQS